MTITCPHCESRYVLPPSLMGPGGARVRCPRCHEAFLVSASGDVTLVHEPIGRPRAEAAAPETETAPEVPVAPADSGSSHAPQVAAPVAESHYEPPPAAAPQASAPEAAGPNTEPEPETPEAVARRLLADMDAEHGPSEIAFAAEQGTIFFAHGTRLMEAFDEYKRIVGRGASVAVFRQALRERWGVELTPAESLRR